MVVNALIQFERLVAAVGEYLKDKPDTPQYERLWHQYLEARKVLVELQACLVEDETV